MASEPTRRAGVVEVIGDALAAYAASLGLDPGVIRPYGAAGSIRDALQSAGLLVTPELTALRAAAHEWRAEHARWRQQNPYAGPASPDVDALIAAVDALDATTGAGT